MFGADWEAKRRLMAISGQTAKFSVGFRQQWAIVACGLSQCAVDLDFLSGALIKDLGLQIPPAVA